ncbi:MAG: NUDIX domain-containing protein [Peptostreptococcaceae bacterium]
MNALYERIEKEDISRGEKGNGVFVIIHCDNFDEKYNYDAKVLMSMRWDNTLGFIGGKVDEGETLHEALVREVREEINFFIGDRTYHHLSSYLDIAHKFGIHCYHMKVSREDMLEIRKTAMDATHSLEEMAGLCLLNIKGGERSPLTNTLLNNQFSATAKHELKDFIELVLNLK